MSKKVIIVAGTKGGIGKSFTTTFIEAFVQDKSKKVLTLDCDNENRTASRFIKNNVIKINPDEEFGLDRIVTCIDEHEAEVIIVDMKAGTGDSSRAWFDDVPLEDLKNDGVEFYLVGCITSDPDSVVTFTRWTQQFKQSMQYIIVKNELNGNDFSYFEEEVEDFYNKVGAITMNIPKLSNRYSQVLSTAGITIKQFLDGEEINDSAFTGRIAKSRLKKYYSQVVKPLEQLFDEDEKVDG